LCCKTLCMLYLNKLSFLPLNYPFFISSIIRSCNFLAMPFKNSTDVCNRTTLIFDLLKCNNKRNRICLNVCINLSYIFKTTKHRYKYLHNQTQTSHQMLMWTLSHDMAGKVSVHTMLGNVPVRKESMVRGHRWNMFLVNMPLVYK
jgi:hypothetical protein